MKVLCVDDESDSLELIATILGDRGAVVRTARSVDEALAIVGAFGPDVLVSDVAMPVRDGYELVRELRRMPAPLSSTPTIALSAHARAEDTERARREGFARFLAKPFDAESLAKAVSESLASG